MNGRFFMTSLGLVAALATALVYGVGGSLAIDGLLTVGTLTALAGLLSQLYGPLTSLTNLRIDVMNALVSFDRVFEVLDLVPMIADAPDAVPVGSGLGRVRPGVVHLPDRRRRLAGQPGVHRRPRQRPNTEVLHDLSFTAAAGQTVALVGRSGGGKTTMTHLIARLYDATSGTVPVAGTDVRELQLDSLRARRRLRHPGRPHVPRHHPRQPALRQPDATDERDVAALAAAQIDELVRVLPDGLDTVVGERGYRLSGGERQRLAIARLLLKAPPIVVLDEATAHLDSESEPAVQRALDLAMEGRTSIVIAHRLSTIRNADLILVVDQGRIVQRGRHDELLADGGLYAELYRTQFAEPGSRQGAVHRGRHAPTSTATVTVGRSGLATSASI